MNLANFDICCCTYNSEKWIDGFFASFEKIDYDKKYIHFYFTDNNSTDNTVGALKQYQQKIGGEYGDFAIVENRENLGFGAGSNSSARLGHGEYVFFLNVDTSISPDALKKVLAKIEYDRTNGIPGEYNCVGAYELRQLPYEHLKIYDPVTMETSWSSGAALILPRLVFEMTGGFDESIFMCCEDVELSWRIRLMGYKLLYVPQATITHHISDITVARPTQLAGSMAGDKMLRLKYGTDDDAHFWIMNRRLYMAQLNNEGSKRLADELVARVDANRKAYRNFYKKYVEKSGFKPDFNNGYASFRTGSTVKCEIPVQDIKYTIIIRTYKRPAVLELTLRSLCNQTYKNFSVIVVEDGKEPISNSAVEKYKNLLDIAYYPLREKVGRCKAGNFGLSAVKTQYAMFLDDDDYLFADYLETITCLIKSEPDSKMYCSSSIEAATHFLNSDGTEFEYERLVDRSIDKLSVVNFFAGNPVPIQAVVFDISLYRECGGFDEELDAFEDWDLWIRFSMHGKISTVNKTLSLYKVPDSKSREKRDIFMDSYREKMFDKMQKYSCVFSAQDIYSIFWSPNKMAPIQVNDYGELVKSSESIQSSRLYVMLSPIRMIGKLFAKISKAFQKCADCINRFFGPSAPEKDTYADIQNFIIKTEDSTIRQILSK